MKLTMAGKLHMIMELLGGQDILDEDGEPTGEKTASFISLEDARKLLELDETDV